MFYFKAAALVVIFLGILAGCMIEQTVSVNTAPGGKADADPGVLEFEADVEKETTRNETRYNPSKDTPEK